MTDIEVDEVLCFVGNEGSEGTANYAMPCWVVCLVKLFLDERCNILLDVEGVEGLDGGIDGLVLHIVGHIDILDNSALVL